MVDLLFFSSWRIIFKFLCEEVEGQNNTTLYMKLALPDSIADSATNKITA